MQEFVDGLAETKYYYYQSISQEWELPPVSLNESCPKIALSPLGKACHSVSSATSTVNTVLELLGSDPLKDASSQEQHSSALGLAEVAVNQPHQATEPMVTPVILYLSDVPREPVEKETAKSPNDVNISAQPALS